jgi:hypothetical protein
MSETTFMGVERDKIDWKPTIDYTKCDYCGKLCRFLQGMLEDLRPRRTFVSR